MSASAVTAAQQRFAREVVPEGWGSVSLGEVFSQVVDTGHSRDLPVLAVTMANGVVRRDSLDRRSEREVPRAKYLRALPGDIAYNTMRMWQGASGLVTEEGYLSPAYIICRPAPGECPEFWSYYFKFPPTIRRFRDHSQGFAKDRYRLYFEHFATVPALRPPPAVQRRLATILSSVDDTIEATQAVIDQLQVVKQAMMAELLTRGIPGRHARFKHTEIGHLPADWDVCRAVDVCKRIVVGIVIRPASYYVPTGVPCLRSKNVREDHINLADVVFISQEANEQLAKSKLRAGDVVTVRTGEPGTSCVVPQRLDGANCVDLIISTPGPTLRAGFFSRFINSAAGQAAIAAGKGGLAQQHFNIGAMKTMLIPVPSTEEQEQIVEVLDAIDERIARERMMLDQWMSVKSALMPVLLSGELRVVPTEPGAAA
jgi:type I restriction enzyme S subunit